MPVVIHTKKSNQQLFTSLAEGIRAPLDAVPFAFRHKGFWPLLLIVFLVNGAIYSGSIYIVFTQLYPLLRIFMPQAEGWQMFAVRLVSGTVITLVSLFAALVFYSFAGSLIASPFLDALSNGTEKRLAGEAIKQRSLTYPFSEIGRIFLVFLKGIAAVAITAIVLFPMNLIPFAGNLLYSLLVLAAVGFFTGSPFFSYPLDRRSIIGSSKMGLMWRYKWAITGTGVGFLILSLVPFLGFMSHCFASVGAAIIFREKILPYIEISHTPDEK